MNPRSLALPRTALLAVCIVALLVMPAATPPVAARTPQDPSDPAPRAVQKQFLPLMAGPGPLLTSIDLIERALAQGKLDDVTALVYKVYAVFGDPRLPAEYHGTNPIRDGTEVMAEADSRYDALPADTQALLLPFLIPPYYVGSWENLQGAQGAAPASILPGGVPPGLPESNLWSSKGNDVVKVWWHKQVPGAERQADLILSAVQGEIWPRLTGLMQRRPITDEGQKNNGGDKRLDIALGKMTAYGLVRPYTGHRIMGPTAIFVNRNLSDDMLRATVAHEFMHALQYTYQLKGNRLYDKWLMESTATWAEDYVYPRYNTEQLYLPDFLDFPEIPMTTDVLNHVYGAYLFPFYLSHRDGAEIIRRMWEATETTDTALEAVNSVIEGGFKERWPEFALYNWNREPLDSYQQWDQVKRGVYAPRIRVPGMLEDLTFATDDFDMSVPMDIQPLAAAYYHFVFPIDEVRSVAFTNPFKYSPDPAARVQALVKVGGAWQVAQDWTDVQGKGFCRDMRAERIEELLIVVTNSNWQDPNHVLTTYQPLRLVATNIGCWRWTGTATGTYVAKGNWTATTTAEVTFQRHRIPSSPDGSQRYENYVPVAGTAVWRMTDGPSECIWAGGPTTFPATSGSLEIQNYVTNEPYRKSYSGHGSITQPLEYTLTCPGGGTTLTWHGGAWFGTASELFKVSEDGRTIDAEWVAQESSTMVETFKWHFEAQREP